MQGHRPKFLHHETIYLDSWRSYLLILNEQTTPDELLVVNLGENYNEK